MFAEDTATFLADHGSPVTWSPSTGGTAVVGLMIFDQAAEEADGGQIISRGYQVTLATANWPGLKRGEFLVIAGEGGGGHFKVRTDLRSLEDGVFSVAPLTKVLTP